MTILGKILVILNLIFSLVTGVLIVTVFVTRTNWKDGYDRLRKLYTVAEANARTYAGEVDKVRADGDAEVKRLKSQVASLQRDVDQARRETDDKSQEYQAFEKRVKTAEAHLESATEEINRRKQEIENLKKVITEKDARMVHLEEQSKDYKDAGIVSRLQAESEHERNGTLLQRNLELEKAIEQRSLGPTAYGMGSGARRPPQDDVKGQVLESDNKSGLVTISIGSDAGLTKGNTLEVYRLQPRPEYVGTIVILDARFHEAVARPMNPLRAGPIQKGDFVASRIMTSRR